MNISVNFYPRNFINHLFFSKYTWQKNPAKKDWKKIQNGRNTVIFDITSILTIFKHFCKNKSKFYLYFWSNKVSETNQKTKTPSMTFFFIIWDFAQNIHAEPIRNFQMKDMVNCKKMSVNPKYSLKVFFKILAKLVTFSFEHTVSKNILDAICTDPTLLEIYWL